MHDALELLFGEERADGVAVGDVQLDEAKARLRRQPGEPVMLEAWVVVVVQVVEADDAVAAREQDLRDVHADEAGRTGDENLHGLMRP